MKIFLKDNFLNDLSDADYKISTVFYESNISETIKEILSKTSSNYLISGYRGSGKSTFVKILSKELYKSNSKDENNSENQATINSLININLGSYNDYTSLLRKIVRSIYLELENISKIKGVVISNSFEQKNPELVKDIKTLYEKTFFDVHSNSMKLEKNETLTIYNWGIDFKAIMIGVIPILLTLGFTLSEYIKEYPIIALMVSTLGAALITWGGSFASNRNLTENEEFIRNSLYDDDIAEYKLMDFLERLKSHGVKVVFAFDEIDKMEEQQVLQFLNEIKPLMMSDVSNFLFVTGQKVFYDYEFSQTLDDPIINSLFTKNIHIELPDKSLFEEVLFSVIDFEETKISRKRIHDFLNYNILNSGKVLRKFINSIRQDIKYTDAGKPYILINNSDLEKHNNDSRILRIIEKIERNSLKEGIYSAGIKDFLHMQLFIAVKKAKNFTLQEFQSFELMNISEYRNDKNLLNLVFEVQNLIEELLEELLMEEFLIKNEKFDEEGYQLILYQWNKQKNLNKIKSANLERIDLEENINRVFKGYLNDEELDEILTKNLSFKFKKLYELRLLKSNKYNTLIENYENYTSNMDDENNLDRMLRSKASYQSLMSEIVENIVCRKLEDITNHKEIKIHNREIVRNTKNSSDILLENMTNNNKIILEIKIFNNNKSIKNYLTSKNYYKGVLDEIYQNSTIKSYELIVFGDYEESHVIEYKKLIREEYLNKPFNITFTSLDDLTSLELSLNNLVKKLD